MEDMDMNDNDSNIEDYISPQADFDLEIVRSYDGEYEFEVEITLGMRNYVFDNIEDICDYNDVSAFELDMEDICNLRNIAKYSNVDFEVWNEIYDMAKDSNVFKLILT